MRGRILKAEGIPADGAQGPALNHEASIESILNSRAYQRLFSGERLAQYREQNRLPKNDQLTATAVEFHHNLLMGTREDTNDIYGFPPSYYWPIGQGGRGFRFLNDPSSMTIFPTR